MLGRGHLTERTEEPALSGRIAVSNQTWSEAPNDWPGIAPQIGCISSFTVSGDRHQHLDARLAYNASTFGCRTDVPAEQPWWVYSTSQNRCGGNALGGST
jgi:hypothetical protein